MEGERQVMPPKATAVTHVDRAEEAVEEGNPEAKVTPKLTVPAWLDAALIQKALESGGDDRQVEEISVSSATAGGDNYSSNLYRVKAKLSDGTDKSVLVKWPALSEILSDMISDVPGVNVYLIEGIMLGEVIPKMEALLEEVAPGRFPPLAARCPLYGASPVNHMVIEDLTPQGFKLADRKRGLGLNHSLLALRTLARYHALSYALLQKEPELARKLPNMWDVAAQAVEQFQLTGIQAAADVCRTWPGFEEYGDLLEKMKPGFMKKIGEIHHPKPDGFNIISHSDFWVNNMMFRYEDGAVKDFRILDFQGSTLQSPALDIIYFLNTSVSDNVSANYEDLLIREYHIALKEILDLLGIETPSLDQLLADIDAHGPASLCGSLNVFPIVKADRTIDMEAVLRGDQSSFFPLYESPLVKRWMQRVLPKFARKGWLRA